MLDNAMTLILDAGSWLTPFGLMALALMTFWPEPKNPDHRDPDPERTLPWN